MNKVLEANLMQGTRSRVPELLAKRGWTAMDLTRKANIAHGTARRLKKGETEGFTVATLQSVAEALDIHWLKLFVNESG